jgi:hypothetical protein
LASARVIFSSVPVKTTVCPATGLSARARPPADLGQLGDQRIDRGAFGGGGATAPASTSAWAQWWRPIAVDGPRLHTSRPIGAAAAAAAGKGGR